MKTFDKVFSEELDKIREEGRAIGMSMSEICSRSGVARASPDRWRSKPPKTIQLVADMQRAVADRKEEMAAEQS